MDRTLGTIGSNPAHARPSNGGSHRGVLLIGAICLGALAACGGGGSGQTGGSGGDGGGGTGGVGGQTGGSGGTGGTGGTLAFACSGKTVSFQADVLPILTCGGAEACHQLTLANPNNTYGWLVNQPTTDCQDGRLRVKPGDPENSYLFDKLSNNDLCTGDPMPKSLTGWEPLPHDEIQTVYDWICQGAKDD